jgi:hypothetical protein
MRCQKIRRLLPLLAGDELPEKQMAKVKEHLKGCLPCREEYEKYVLLVRNTRRWLDENRVGWEEQEWRDIVQNAVNQGTKRKSVLVPWPFPRGWAYALMAGVMLLIATFIVRPPFVEHNGLTPKLGDEGEAKKQEVVSMTMVSKETGLKIVWFLDKNFDLEDNK